VVRHFQYYNIITIKRPDNCQLTLTLFGLFVLMGQIMDDKTCTKCNCVFPATTEYFYKKVDGKYGLTTKCKSCAKECVKKCYNKHQNKRLNQKKEYYKSNSTTLNQKNHQYQLINKEKISEQRKQYRQDNIEKIKLAHKTYRQNNKDKLNKYYQLKAKNDLNYKLARNIRSRIKVTIKENRKTKSSLELLGCSLEQVRQHIESQFQEGMSWSNWSFYGWHIDHIRPISSFDLSDPIQQKQCFHYTNLQPLWAKDNLAKGNKIIPN
jgi:hypothetical protein